ncbi:unnamed protein product [Protopolystoma xenopodis]|uniref:Uncharacterized protein n=1 Tax=Protopolystoma xenopodis TaxID=117903 RepID=A0A3S5AP75_9PLAT|nr:unnamed protein product [Protopolystoma xenopodis]
MAISLSFSSNLHLYILPSIDQFISLLLYPSVHLLHLFTNLFLYLFIHLSICPSVHLSIHQAILLSISSSCLPFLDLLQLGYLTLKQSVSPFQYISIYPPIYKYIFLSIHLSTYL